VKREEYTNAQWGKVLCDRWDALDALHQRGVIDEHPGKAGWNKDSETLRKAAREGDTDAHDDYTEATTTGVKGGPKNGAKLVSAEDANALARVQRLLGRLS
jgi:hypothetical protein